jgi:hypothetical protein
MPQGPHRYVRLHVEGSQQGPHVFRMPRIVILGTRALLMQRSK